MRKIIIDIFLIWMCSCSLQPSEEDLIVSLFKKEDALAILDMLETGELSSDYQTSTQKSLIHLSVDYSNLLLLQGFVERGIALDMTDQDGNTPLMLSILKDNSLFAETLIDFQADPNYQNKDGNTALILASKKKMESIILALLEKMEYKTNPNLKNSQNRSAISYLSPGSLSHTILSHYLERFNSLFPPEFSEEKMKSER